MDRYLDAAVRLHGHLQDQHWNGEVMVGPDPGIRFNARAGRFIKSYLPFLKWSDDLIYLQAQGYWIMDNWLLYDTTAEDRYRDLALQGSRGVLAAQVAEGYWAYPNPEWEGRIATVEGCFAALALLESYSREAEAPLLEGALAWYGYLKLGIGFRKQDDEAMLAVNYFAHASGDHGGVPNNSTLVLWLLARLFEVTHDESYLEYAAPLARWLAHVQVESGELPYAIGTRSRSSRPHYLCHQYNAFEFMDLVHYHRITGDESVVPMMAQLANFLSAGITDEGYARFDCGNDSIEVVYYTAAVAQALSQATVLGFGDFSAITDRAYDRVIGEQRPNGSFRFHSRANYRLLRDRRSYPRYLSMILHHLLLGHRVNTPGRAE